MDVTVVPWEMVPMLDSSVTDPGVPALDEAPRVGMVVRCPACDQGSLVPGRPGQRSVCPACGRAVDAALVAEMVTLAHYRDEVDRRMAWLRSRLAAEPVAPDITAMPATDRPLPGHRGAQRLLLAVGAVLVVIAGLAFLAVAWPFLGATGQVLVLGVLTAVFVVVGAVASRRLPTTAEVLAGLAAAFLVVDLVGVYVLDVVGAARLGAGAYTLCATAAFVVMVAVLRLRLPRQRAYGVACGLGLVALPLSVALAVADAIPPGAWDGAPTLALVLVAAATTALSVAAPLPREASGVVAVGGRVWLYGVTLSETAVMILAAGDPDLTRTAAWVAGAGLACVAALAVLRHPVERTLAGAVGVVAAAWAGATLAAFLWSGATAAAAAAVLAATGAAGIATVARRGSQCGWDQPLEAAERWGVAAWTAVAAGVLVPAVADASDPLGHQATALVLAVAATCLLVYGTLPHRWAAVWAFAGVGALAWVVWLGGRPDVADTLVPETWTGPMAVLAGVAGAVTAWRDAARPRRTVAWLPALVLAVLPTALWAWDGPDPVRSSVALVLGVAMVAVGAWRGWLAPCAAGTVTAVVAACALLAPTVVALPWWLTAGTAGLVLLLIGARFEAVRGGGRRLDRWARGLR